MDSQGQFLRDHPRRSLDKGYEILGTRSRRFFYMREAASLKPRKRTLLQKPTRMLAIASVTYACLVAGVFVVIDFSIPKSVRAILWPDLSGLTPEATVAAQGQLRLAAVQLIVATGASIALFYTARNYNLTRRGQVTDRFTKALERLGSDQVYIRIGGVAAIKQILLDAPDQAEDAARVLQAFIYEQTEEAGEIEEIDDSESLPPDVTASIEALGAAAYRALHFVRLPGRNLTGVDLCGMTLNYARFNKSRLRMADFSFSRMPGGSLEESDCTGADFAHSSFEAANLTRSDMTASRMDFATFSSAKMDKAQMVGVQAKATRFNNASLKGAALYGAFTGCDFRGANLTDADLRGMEAAHSDFTRACLDRADLTTSDLSEAIGLTVDQILRATLSKSTQLPDYLLIDERVANAVSSSKE
ncbi:pentapeptide repeat-containing protein [Streptomyces erythrochromogenes]|uniref:pentapeptide repeat-containing protein n=1 Tax=Streptomyces erythrochromogenes TaxID=285574 RepID=UPI0033260B60